MKTIHSLLVVLTLGFIQAMAAYPMAPIDPSAYKAPVRVSCVGDSITQGSKKGNYPTQLQALLGDKWVVTNFGLIDMHAPFEGKPELVPDRVHPSPAGYGVMAETAFTALTGKPAPQAATK